MRRFLIIMAVLVVLGFAAWKWFTSPETDDHALPPVSTPTNVTWLDVGLARFPVGQREFDPMKVGYVTEVQEPQWIFDTTIPGNENSGHEFGSDLPATSRQELIEYVKTL